MVAENMREHMAAMGFRNVDDMIGRADMLEVNQDIIKKYPRLAGINLDKILLPAASLRENVAQRCVRKQVTASGICLGWCSVMCCKCGAVWCGLVCGLIWFGVVSMSSWLIAIDPSKDILLVMHDMSWVTE